MTRVPGEQDGDRKIWWPVCTVFGVPSAIILISAFAHSIYLPTHLESGRGLAIFWPADSNDAYALFLALVILVAGFIASASASLIVLMATRRRQWKRAITTAILPAALFAVALQPAKALGSLGELGELLNFKIWQQEYRKDVATLPIGLTPRLAIFVRGGLPGSHSVIFYDESDELALLPSRQSVEWRDRAEKLGIVSCGYGAFPLGDHFYGGTIFC